MLSLVVTLLKNEMVNFLNISSMNIDNQINSKHQCPAVVVFLILYMA